MRATDIKSVHFHSLLRSFMGRYLRQEAEERTPEVISELWKECILMNRFL